MKKYNPILEDETYWRYQDLVESWVDFIKESFGVDGNKEEFTRAAAHLAKKIYDMGYDDASAALRMAYEEKEKILN
jgi:hypothetical protein